MRIFEYKKQIKSHRSSTPPQPNVFSHPKLTFMQNQLHITQVKDGGEVWLAGALWYAFLPYQVLNRKHIHELDS